MNMVFTNEQLLSLACDSLKVHSAVLFLPNGHGAFVVAAAAAAGSPTPVAATIAPGRGLVGWILRNAQPLTLNAFDPAQSVLGYYEGKEEHSITAFMGVPLPHGGALCVDAVTPREFTLDDQRLLEQFAALLPPSSEPLRAADSDETSRYFDAFAQLQLIRKESPQWSVYLGRFLRLVAESTQFDYVTLAMLPEGSASYTVEGESTPLVLNNAPVDIPLSNGLVGWVLRSDGMPVYLEGVDVNPSTQLFGKREGMPRFQTIACLPVWNCKSVCGVLAFANIEARVFTNAVRAFTSMAASELGVHIESLYLHHRIQRMLAKATVRFDAPKHTTDVHEKSRSGE